MMTKSTNNRRDTRKREANIYILEQRWYLADELPQLTTLDRLHVTVQVEAIGDERGRSNSRVSAIGFYTIKCIYAHYIAGLL